MTESQESVDAIRENVRQHFDEIESRVNPKKVAERFFGRVQDSYNENPTPWLASAAGAAIAVVGSIALAVFGRK